MMHELGNNLCAKGRHAYMHKKYCGLSLSFQVARHKKSTGGELSGKATRSLRGLGASPSPQKILKFRGREMSFPAFSDIFPMQMQLTFSFYAFLHVSKLTHTIKVIASKNNLHS